MTSSLGGDKSLGVRIHVKNGFAGILKRGTVVSWSSIAANNPVVSFLDLTRNKDYGSGTVRELEVPYITVIKSVADAATPGGASRLGVVAADIPQGGFGELICFGLALVEFFATDPQPAPGEVITSNANGLAIDAAAATSDNPIGLVMETVSTAGGLHWCWINCMNPAGASSTAFMGKTY